MKIGIFGGSFDPVHIEHVRLVQSAIQTLGLDKVFVVPAALPPHKPWKRMTDDAVRLQACRIAFAAVEKAEVNAYELEQKGMSYTYLTCRAFQERYPTAQLYFLLGTDMLRDFPTWRYPERILETATLAVCGRAEETGWLEKEQEDFRALFGREFVPISYEGRAVSSKQARVLLAADEDTDGWLDEKVADYLKGSGVYRIPYAKQALALQKESRKAHTLRVTFLAVERAPLLRLDERQVMTAALMHDCAKNLRPDDPILDGFSLKEQVPAPVFHQFAGAYVAENRFGVTNGEILDAIRYHTSGRPGMSLLEKLIYLADGLEEGRSYDGVDELRRLFWRKEGLDDCLRASLKGTLDKLRKEGQPAYRLTQEAYEYYQKS